MGGSILFQSPLRSNSMVFNTSRNYQVIKIANCQFEMNEILEEITCASLLSLDIKNTPVTDEALINFLNQSKQVQKLFLADCPNLTASSMEFICSNLKKLSEFSVWSNASSSSLHSVPHLSALQKLSLHSSHNLTNNLLKKIISSCKLLEELDISKCTKITNKVVSQLSKASNLASLNLSDCPHLSDEGVSKLINVPKLAELSISRNILFFFCFFVHNYCFLLFLTSCLT